MILHLSRSRRLPSPNAPPKASARLSIANIAKQRGEFVDTWSIDGFIGESCQPADLGWGTHEKPLPADGQRQPNPGHSRISGSFEFSNAGNAPGGRVAMGQPGGSLKCHAPRLQCALPGAGRMVDVIRLASGVASGTVMGPSRHLTAAFTVLFGGMPVTRLTSMSLQDSTNAPGVRIVPSQPTVIVLSP